MIIMKKKINLIILFVAFISLLGLASCGKKAINNNDNNINKIVDNQGENEDPSDDKDIEPSENKDGEKDPENNPSGNNQSNNNKIEIIKDLEDDGTWNGTFF